MKNEKNKSPKNLKSNNNFDNCIELLHDGLDTIKKIHSLFIKAKCFFKSDGK